MSTKLHTIVRFVAIRDRGKTMQLHRNFTLEDSEAAVDLGELVYFRRGDNIKPCALASVASTIAVAQRAKGKAEFVDQTDRMVHNVWDARDRNFLSVSA